MAKVIAILGPAAWDAEANSPAIEVTANVSPQNGETFQGQSFISRFLCVGTESTQQLNTLAFNAVKKDAQDLSGVTIGNNDITITKFT